jgi:transposase-like protein
MIEAKVKANPGSTRAFRATESPWGEESQAINSHHALTLGFPDAEVAAKAVRRRFTAEYKLKVLTLADACIEPGCIGKLLRREGLYFSYLNTWRGQRERGVLSALSPRKRGRKESVCNPLHSENEKLRKENNRLVSRLRQAEIIIDVQKKISEILGIPLATPEAEGSE